MLECDDTFTIVYQRSALANVHAQRFHAALPRRKNWGPAVREQVRRRTGGKCYLCWTPLPPQGWHIDHVLAFSANPLENDVRGNLLPACAECNLRKGALPLVELDFVAVNAFTLRTEFVAKAPASLLPGVREVLFRALNVKRRARMAAAPAVGFYDVGVDQHDLAAIRDELEQMNQTLR